MPFLAAVGLQRDQAVIDHNRRLYLYSALCEGLAFIAALTFSIAVARTLNPAGKGLVTLAGTTATMAFAIASMGLGKSIVQELAPFRPSSWTAIRIASPAGLLAATLTLAIAALLWLVPSHPHHLLPLVALHGVLAVTAMTVESGLRASYELTTQNKSSLLSSFAMLFGAAVLLARASILFAILIPSLALAARVAYGAPKARSSSREPLDSRRDVPKDVRSSNHLVRRGLAYQGYAVLNTVQVRGDIILLGLLSTTRQVGFYSVGAATAQMLWRLPVAINLVALPSLAGRRDPGSRSHTSTRRAATATMLGAAILIATAGPFLIPLAYGGEFRASVPLLLILLPGTFLMGYAQLISVIPLSMSDNKTLVQPTIVGLATNVGLNVALVPTYGATGAAVASLVSYSATTVILVILVRVRWGIPLRSVEDTA